MASLGGQVPWDTAQPANAQLGAQGNGVAGPGRVVVVTTDNLVFGAVANTTSGPLPAPAFDDEVNRPLGGFFTSPLFLWGRKKICQAFEWQWLEYQVSVAVITRQLAKLPIRRTTWTYALGGGLSGVPDWYPQQVNAHPCRPTGMGQTQEGMRATCVCPCQIHLFLIPTA